MLSKIRIVGCMCMVATSGLWACTGSNQRVTTVSQQNGSNSQNTGDASVSGSLGDGSTTRGDVVFLSSAGSDASVQVDQLLNEGNQAYVRRDYRAAADAFRRAYDLERSPQMAFNVARAYERLGNVDESIRYYQLFLDGNPPAELRASVTRSMEQLRAYAERIRSGVAQPLPSQSALEAEGNRLLESGLRQFRAGRFTEALIYFDQAQQYINTPPLYYNLGVAHERLSQVGPAAQRGQHRQQAIEFFGEYLQSLGDSAEADELRRRIQQLQQIAP